MLLLAGLGNPGEKYARNRHNVGAMAADAIADRWGLAAARQRFQGVTRDGLIDGIKAVILKPATFMNESGRSVGEAMRFYKLTPADVVVLHDEIDLAAGKLRVKAGGGHAGHNGLRSIDEHIGPHYRRVRIGIGHPGGKHKVTPHVLNDFSKDDAAWLAPLLAAIAGAAPLMMRGEDAAFQSRVAAILNPNPNPNPNSGLKTESLQERRPDGI